MITREQIEDWFGNDATKEDYIGVLEMIINGRYIPEQFKKDVVNYE